MREIKFRVWDGTSLRYSFDGFSSEICVLTELWEYLKTADYITEQFTGLKDKNGKEIYEGDIVNCFSFDKLYRTAEVVFDIKLGMYKLKVINAEFIDITYLYYAVDGYGRSIEVIGNIHENPELLLNKHH